MSDSNNSSSKTPIFKKWWFWLIIVVVIIGVGAGTGNSNHEPQKVGERSNSTNVDNQETGKADDESIFKIGDVVKSGDYEVVVKSVERNYTSGNQFVKPSEGKEFVRVSVEVRNTSQDKKSYNLLDWKIEDADGALESINITGTSTDDQCLDSGELVEGGKKSGTLVFEVPKGQTGLKLHYQPLLSFGVQEVVIEL